jgi:trehalose-6-phosphate synthase
MGQQNQGIQL